VRAPSDWGLARLAAAALRALRARRCTGPGLTPAASCPLFCLQALPEMLRSASLAAEKGLGPDQAYVRNMLGFLWEPLVEAIPKVRPPRGGPAGAAGSPRTACRGAAALAPRPPA
jgi:hypothetical protein